MNTFMQSHSHTLIMKLENINMYTITYIITPLSLAAWNNQGEKG